MGKVTITEHERVTGVYMPVETTYEYTYCDRCGSFDIERRTRLPRVVDQGLSLVGCLALAGAFVAVVFIQECRAGAVMGLVGVAAGFVTVLAGQLRCITA